jgi:hypothetical protein
MTLPASRVALRRSLRVVAGLPAWGSTPSYGLWLQFGKPELSVWEPTDPAASSSITRRLVQPLGTHALWINACRWQILEGRRMCFHSAQRGLSLLRACHFLDGRLLVGVRVTVRPYTFAFEFEGVSLLLKPKRGADAQDPMWHLHSWNMRTFLRCEAGGHFHYGPRKQGKVVKLEALEFAL